ncbi:MAG: ISAzo13 family transposase, partial [Dehalococcoidia bacterium]
MMSLAELTAKLNVMWPLLDERTRRLVAAREAVTLGYGGVSLVHRACGLSRRTILKGIREIESGVAQTPGRIRRPGAGRKPATVADPALVETLEGLIDAQTRGDPESPLRWIGASTRAIAAALRRQHHGVSHTTVAQLLHDLDYSLQSNRKSQEGTDHPDRDAPFRHIARAVRRHLAQGCPVISVETKKKELIGPFANAGRQWRPVAQPQQVRTHDVPTPAVPRAYPYGIYDVGRNTGFVNVGTDHDTGAFAVASIRGWWRHEGRRLYPKASTILITADGGGSNG